MHLHSHHALPPQGKLQQRSPNTSSTLSGAWFVASGDERRRAQEGLGAAICFIEIVVVGDGKVGGLESQEKFLTNRIY